MDRINIVDVESTCWESSPPAGETGEIIEIGISVVNLKTFEIESTESILVKPIRSKVSPFCTKLTTLTQEMVDTGLEHYKACEKLITDYNSKNRVWASFGDYDRKMFEQMARDRGAPYPFGPRHINVKTLGSIVLGLDKEIGMDAMLKEFGLSLDGVHHRGGDDSANIAKIFARIMFKSRLLAV